MRAEGNSNAEIVGLRQGVFTVQKFDGSPSNHKTPLETSTTWLQPTETCSYEGIGRFEDDDTAELLVFS